MAEKMTRNINSPFDIKRIIFLIAIVFFVTFNFWGPAYAINVLTLIMLYMSLGQMWNLLSGFTGLTSLGQQVFIGIGGFSLAVCCQKFGLPIPVGFIVGGAFAVGFALLISIPVFKMNGVYFTIGTWIIAEAMYVFFVNWKFVNYGIGFTITSAFTLPNWAIPLLATVMGLGSIILVQFVVRSKLGLAMMAVRDNTSAAEVRGVHIYKTKLIVFMIASCWIALTGVVIYLNQAYIVPSAALGIDWTIAMTFIVIIGGSGTIEGPIIGAIVYVILKQYFYNFPGISNIFLGAVAIIIILIAPGGIMGFIKKRWNIDLFGVRRKMPE